MKNKLTMAALVALSAATVSLPGAAGAQDYYHGHGRDHHDDRGRHDYRRHRCGGGNGAVGTIAGGAGGALLGHTLGGGTLGTVGGGVGGALVGRHFDKQHTRHERGC
jgi:hypothetical protein